MRTLGLLVLALQDQSTAVSLPESGATTETDVVSLILNASPLVWVVLAVLLFFSAVSWGIILYKQRQLARAAQQTLEFLEVFRKSSRFSEVQAVCGGLTASPLVGLFQSGYAELNAQLRSPGENRPTNPAGRPTLRSLDAVDRALLRATTTELAKLEQRVSFLATTASLTPYIGLFGTVWGILTSFQDIGASGSTSLSTVAPGIAEALVATALGLFAAIPAVYFYNDITSRVKAFANQMEDFSMEFLTIAERNFT
ncbi:MAG TPA: MotA/TolQ/ExbB proton channel family protein [Vicinamibacterales bacterium]|nr:MotA/TolQ/ExbB proton channel family protein [Vicinamibacterales bacterium]